MTKDELVEPGARALRADGGTVYEFHRKDAAAVIDAVLPMVTEAIAAAINAKHEARLAEDWAGAELAAEIAPGGAVKTTS